MGQAVREATLQSLQGQNRLNANAAADIFYALGRLGLDEAVLLNHLEKYLNDEHYQLAKGNLSNLRHNPRLVASAFSFAALLDRIHYGAFSETSTPELLKDHAVQAAVAVSGQASQWSEFWQAIDASANPIEQFCQAMALGWQAKWQP